MKEGVKTFLWLMFGLILIMSVAHSGHIPGTPEHGVGGDSSVTTPSDDAGDPPGIERPVSPEEHDKLCALLREASGDPDGPCVIHKWDDGNSPPSKRVETT